MKSQVTKNREYRKEKEHFWLFYSFTEDSLSLVTFSFCIVCLMLWKLCRKMADFDEIYEEHEGNEENVEESFVSPVPDPVVVRGAGNMTV